MSGKHRKTNNDVTVPDVPDPSKQGEADAFDKSYEESRKHEYPVVAEGSKITVAPVRKWGGQ